MLGKYTQTDQELRDHLYEQLRFLRVSAASYDSGFEGEAKRLATTVRVLVHDTKKSKSLLHQLNLKHIIRMHDTALPFDSRNLAPHQGLVVIRIDVPAGVSGSEVSFTLVGKDEPFGEAPPGQARTKMTYEPRVSAGGGVASPTSVPFRRWWEEIVIKDSEGHTFTRSDLVLAMTNKEGGAHVDPKLDKQYARLTRFHSQGWQVTTGEVRLPPDNSLVGASIRQIAHELLVSIEESFPDMCVGRE